eukprot:TRINITY_DN7381_c0_g1_i2.p1 TRINITY_DN7381_c0_g1~~TRINITY_DN7381_c0_g1_i2.p1  ORF type:complete len:374 (+),score=62.74 TRINITY_DN7381_c0_g1_i2:106-1227(+)
MEPSFIREEVLTDEESSDDPSSEDVTKHTGDARVLPEGYEGSVRAKIFAFCEYDRSNEFLQKSLTRSLALLYQALCITLILVSTASFVVLSEPTYFHRHPLWATAIDVITVAAFTLDYFVRLACSPNRKLFMTSLFNVFDLLSFAPAYLEWILGDYFVVSVLRLLRLTRVFRFFRIIKYSVTLQIALQALRNSGEGFMLLWLLLLVNLTFFSSLVYFVEEHYCYWNKETQRWTYVQTNQTSQFQSITETFWWNIVTLTTVGYGDVIPKTVLGKVLAGVTMVVGMIQMSFPITVFSTNFHSLYNDWKTKKLQEGRVKKLRELGGSKLKVMTKLVFDLRMLKCKASDLHVKLEGLQSQLEERVDSLESYVKASLG